MFPTVVCSRIKQKRQMKLNATMFHDLGSHLVITLLLLSACTF
jgi:hypothetical protein